MAARQPLAAGLPRPAFVTTKLLVLVAVAFLFWALSLLIGLGAALIATPTGVWASAVRVQDLQLFGGYLLALLGYGAASLLLAFLLRSTAAALITLGLYVAAVDTGLGSFLSVSDRYAFIARFLPTRVFDALMNPARYNVATLAAVRARFAAADVPFPEMTSTTALYAVALGYIAILFAATYVAFARRDL